MRLPCAHALDGTGTASERNSALKKSTASGISISGTIGETGIGVDVAALTLTDKAPDSLKADAIVIGVAKGEHGLVLLSGTGRSTRRWTGGSVRR